MRFPMLMRESLRFVIILTVLAGLLVSIPPAQVSASPNAVAVRLRIGVAVDGLVRITQSELAAALSGSGVDPATVNPHTFTLSSLGQVVPIRVTGESDGFFGAADRIEFFGQQFRSTLADPCERQMEEKYTDERVYWLEVGGVSCNPTNCRVQEVGAAPQNNLTPPVSFPTTVRAEASVRWSPLWSLDFDTCDTWYWDLIKLPSGGPVDVTKSYAYSTPYPDVNFPGTVRVEVVPANPSNAGGPYPSHWVSVSLGGTQLASASWGGSVLQVISGGVPAALLGGQTTTFQVRVVAQAPAYAENMYVNYWELDYHRLFRASNDRLDFRAESGGLQEFRVTDFTSSPVAVWDVTDPLRPKRLTGAAMSGASGSYAARFRASPQANDRFWMQGESSFAAPVSISRPNTAWLRAPSDPDLGPGADTVIVTPASLRAAADTLASWHRAHDRRTVVVDIQDVYDEFNAGIRHPQAVPKMLAWAADHWTAPAPAYLVLMGDGHVKLKNFDSPGAPVTNPIPPYLTFQDPWQGEIASDGLYGDYRSDTDVAPAYHPDGLPDVAVGRIPVNTMAEAAPVLDKIAQYDESIRLQPWQQRAVFAADFFDPDAGDFWALSDQIIDNHTPSDLISQRIYLGTAAYPNAGAGRIALKDAINGGALMVQWTGHGAPQIWSRDKIWQVTDVPLLTNAHALPVVMTFNCLDGFFIDWTSSNQSLAEAMLLRVGGGSIAAISPAGEGLTMHQTEFREILMDTIFKDGVRDLGRALQAAKQRYAQVTGRIDYMVYQMNLFGDPALQLPMGDLPKPPVVRATRSGAAVNLNWSPGVAETVHGLSTTIDTYGIWRSTRPYFDPDAADCNVPTTCALVKETSDLTWPDDGAGLITPIGQVANNYFYVVRAQNDAGWSANSNRTGEFDFAVTPGTP